MIAVHLRQLYNAAPADIAYRSFSCGGSLLQITCANERYTFTTNCDCEDAEFAVYPNTHPANTTGSVNVLGVCAKHGDRTCHGQRMKSEAEYQADYALTREVSRRIAPGFSFNRVRRGSVPGWGDPRYSKKPEVKP